MIPRSNSSASGLACAVLLAGILVITLAPAAILLMGESAWWLPRWLDRFLPHINIEGDDSPDLPQVNVYGFDSNSRIRSRLARSSCFTTPATHRPLKMMKSSKT